MTTNEQREVRTALNTILSPHETALDTVTDRVHKATVVPDRLEDAASAEVGQTPD